MQSDFRAAAGRLCTSLVQALVCLGPVFLSDTLAEQRCDTISPGVYPSLQPFARRGLLWAVHLLWATQEILHPLPVAPQASKIVHYGR